MTRDWTTLALYAAAVLIWGGTWVNMKYQLGEVAPAASLTYRYLTAGTIVLIGAAAFGKTVMIPPRAHVWCALQGALMFSINYWLTYLAAASLTSGIIAVMFAGASAITMLVSAGVSWIRPPARALLGGGLGIVGIGCVFWPEIEKVEAGGPEITAGLLVMTSVVLFSVGGLVGARNMQAGQPRYATIGWAMLYGGILIGLVTIARGESFGWSWQPAYLWSLMWLTLFGSVAVFVLYFSVVERIGAQKASYATVMFPIVALVVSTFVEDYEWPLLALIGVPLALAGNALVLSGKTPLPTPAPGAPGERQPLEWPVNFVDLPHDGGGIAHDLAEDTGLAGDGQMRDQRLAADPAAPTKKL